MTRSLKNFMKAKKPMRRCGECECLTLAARRCNDAFCNCGTSSEGTGVEYAFKDWDGTILKKGSIDEGATPKAPADPTREGYTFTGWEPEVGPLSKDTTYVAQYEINSYTVTFVDDDGTTVLDEQTLEYGAIPVYAGETPTKEPTAQYTYTFSGWTPEIATVTADATYTAIYTAIVNVIPVESISNLYVSVGEIAVGESTTGTIDYSPTNANDFSGITFVPNASYEEGMISAEITSYNNGVATLTITGVTAGSAGLDIYLNGEETGEMFQIVVTS